MYSPEIKYSSVRRMYSTSFSTTYILGLTSEQRNTTMVMPAHCW